MRAPDEVAAMRRLYELGWGTRRITAEIGCNRETVQRYLAAGGWACRVPTRPSLLAGHADWLAERLRRHRGNADVVRQELASELGITVSLRTVERAVSHLRRELAAEALATVRFETPPGRQLGMSKVELGRRLGLDEKAVRRLVDPLYRSHIEKLEAALHILGRRMELSVYEDAEVEVGINEIVLASATPAT